MSLVAWILFGLATGFIGSRLVNSPGSTAFVDALLGILGAVTGGFLFTLIGAEGFNGFNLWGLFMAVCGASFFLFLYYAASGRYSL